MDHPQHVAVLGQQVELVESYTYTSVLLSTAQTAASHAEITRRAILVREAMFALDRNIWRFTMNHASYCFTKMYSANIPVRCGDLVEVDDRDHYPRRSTHWMYGASGPSSMYIGQFLLPMMRFVLDLDWTTGPVQHHSYFVAVIFPFLVIPATLTDGRIIARLCRITFWALLETGDGGLAGPDNPG